MVGLETDPVTLEFCVEHSQKSKNKSSIEYSYTPPWHIPSGLTSSAMFICTLFVVIRKCKQLKCPVLDEWIMKMQMVDTLQYYPGRKKNEVMKSADTEICN